MSQKIIVFFRQDETHKLIHFKKKCIYISAGNTSELRDKGEAVLTSVRTKSIDSQLDFIEEAEHETNRDYEDL